MDERPTEPSDVPEEERDADTPYGAIAVTAFLALTILVSWGGMYVLNLVRS